LTMVRGFRPEFMASPPIIFVLFTMFYAFEVARPDVLPFEGWPVLLSCLDASEAKSRLFCTRIVDFARF
jgi:hypothetical protein